MKQNPGPSVAQIFASTSPEKFITLVAAVQQADAADFQLDTTGKVYFLRNFTIELIEPYVKYYLYKQQIKPRIAYSGYGTAQQELLDRDSSLHKFEPDAIVLTLILDLLDPTFGKSGWTGDKARQEIESLLNLLAQSTQATILVNSFLPPFYPRSGLLIASGANDIEGELYELNRFLRAFVRQHGPRFVLCDWDRLLRIVGETDAMDYRYWYMAKSPFKRKFLHLYAREIARLVTLLKGKLKKCLVLDCDNTLWGGVVGEDGVDGLQLDPHEWPGKAFYDFHAGILDLIGRGVLVALCSKNNEEDVWAVLDKHPHCLLKQSHLAGWRINWENKAANLWSLAQELRLGLDSFVYIDDDPREFELISQAFPQVTTLRVPTHLYDLPQTLFRDGLFDRLQTTAEDTNRTQSYQAERQREQHQKQYASVHEYLASLEIVARIRPAMSTEVPRIAQLTQRTNQFNLTVRRYSDLDVVRLLEIPDSAVFTLGTSDRFGDLGLIGVFRAEKRGEIARIDIYLLSCRALGRGLERAFLAYCINQLEQRWAITQWVAPYVATAKNRQVADFVVALGFTKDHSTKDDSYRLNRGSLSAAVTPYIRIVEE